MRRRIAILFTFVFISSFTFAKDFFAQRFFEVKLDFPVSITNNAFQLKDLLQEEVVIDLTEIANNMPAKGFAIVSTIDPAFELNVNALGIQAGVSAGVETFGKFGISKDIFDFLGNGNELNEELNIGINTDTDIFIHADAFGAFKLGDFKISVNPSVFIPVVHIATNKSGVTFKNTDEGKILVDLDASADIYTVCDGLNFNLNEAMSSIGFDMGGSISFPIKDIFEFTGSVRFPVVPGRLKYVSNASFQWGMETTLQDIAGQNFELGEFEKYMGAYSETMYNINRPLKINGKTDFKPMGDFLVFTGGLGIGVRNPFKKGEGEFFPEYYAGATASLKSILKGSFSTELTDQMFKHTLSGSVNVRAFQLDIALSLASSSFVTSFGGAGFALDVATYFGF